MATSGWPAKLQDNQVGFIKLDNVFSGLADYRRARAFADRVASLDWPSSPVRGIGRTTRLGPPGLMPPPFRCARSIPTTPRTRDP